MTTWSLCGALFAAWMLAGCPGSSDGNSERAPSALPNTRASAAAPATGAAPPQAAQGQSACPLWRQGLVSLTARDGGGRADFFRELRYDATSGTVEVHDSDPFASGKEEKDPRVIKNSKKLSADEKSRVEQSLFSICPDAQAMQRQCAPGGCSHLDVKDAAGTTTAVEDPDTVRAVMKTLAPFFPELRTQ